MYLVTQLRQPERVHACRAAHVNNGSRWRREDACKNVFCTFQLEPAGSTREARLFGSVLVELLHFSRWAGAASKRHVCRLARSAAEAWVWRS